MWLYIQLTICTVLVYCSHEVWAWTDGPTERPTEEPTWPWTEEPTDAPTERPTDYPTDGPTDGPTDYPTDGPTDGPTEPPTEAPPGTCPDGWFNADHLGCFYFDNSKPDRHLSWVEAQDSCDSLGGYLAEIQTEEQATLIASIARVEESLTGVGDWWLGLTDMGHEGRWIWEHSLTDSMFTYWAPGHPNADLHNTDDCVLISLTENFLWKDVPCYERMHAAPICQRDLDLNMTSTTPQTTPGTEPPATTTSYMNHVELRGGDGYSSGNVFVVNEDGFLGPVCDDIWVDVHASVVCRQLGFSEGTHTRNSYFGSVPSKFAMDDVNCDGDEKTIQECRYLTSDDCESYEGAGVRCS